MAKVKFIRCDQWKRGVYVFLGSLAEMKAWVSGKTKDEWSEEFFEMVSRLKEDEIGIASYNYDKDGTGVILMPKFPKTPTELACAAHEVLHAVFVMLDFCRVDYIPYHNNETFTYLHEHIMRNLLERDGYYDE